MSESFPAHSGALRICGTCSAEIPEESPLGICPACTFLRMSETLSGGGLPQSEARPEIEGYEVGGLLGRGGMGDVYLATEEKLDRIVAIKVLRSDGGSGLNVRLAGADETKARFFQEAKALSALSHPAIVTIFDFGETMAGDPYFAMEYVDGTDLQQRLNEEPLDTSTLLRWGRQLCDALEYAHAKGVVHRDIKPANVLVSTDGYVKLVDFGLAKVYPRDQKPGASMTFSQVAVGTPDYVAPEQIVDSEKVDHRADIYSMGVLLYEMATGKIPRGSWRKASEINPRLGRGFDSLIQHSLAPEPAKRIQTIEAFRKQLDAAGNLRASRASSILWMGGVALLGAVCATFWIGGFPGKQGDEIAESKNLYEEFHSDPVPMSFPPYPLDQMLEIPITKREMAFPLKKGSKIGTPFLFRLVDGTVKEIEIPEEVDLRFSNCFEWTSPSKFVAPAKDGGIVRVTLTKDKPIVDVVLRGLDDAVQVEASQSAGLVLRANGSIAAWPAGRVHPYYPPKKPIGSVVKIAAGEKHSIALLEDGSVRVWGGADLTEMPVPYRFDNVVDVGAGSNFSAVLTENGRVFAWGDNAYGQCDVPGDLPAAARLVCLGDAVYVLLQNGLLRGWGRDVELDSEVTNPVLYKEIFAPSQGAGVFAEKTSGEWEPIAGTIPENWTPESWKDLSLSRFTEVSINGEFMLGWRVPERTTSQVDGTAVSKLISIHRSHSHPGGKFTGSIPRKVDRVVSFAGSYSVPAQSKIGHCLALTDENELVVWGENRFGQKNVPAISGTIKQVTSGDRFCAALTTEGSIFVWGANKSQRPLAPISHLDFVQMDAGENFGVALDSKGFFFGWGNNEKGQLNPPDPRERFRLIAATGQTTLGLTTENKLQIWGEVRDHNRSNIPDAIRHRAKEVTKIGLTLNTCWVLLNDNTLMGWGNVGQKPDEKKPLWISYPERVSNVRDFWTGKCGMIVRLTDDTFRGYHIAWQQDELSRLLRGAKEIQITQTHIFAGVR